MSRREIPFNPLPTVRKEVSWEDMQVILARRNPTVQVEVMSSARNDRNELVLSDPLKNRVKAGAASAQNTLRWAKPEGEARRSVCGRYSVARVTCMGTRLYELWKLAPGGSWFTQIGKRLESFEQARQLAEQDAKP